MIPSLTKTRHEHEPVQLTSWVERTTLSWRHRSRYLLLGPPASPAVQFPGVGGGLARLDVAGGPHEAGLRDKFFAPLAPHHRSG